MVSHWRRIALELQSLRYKEIQRSRKRLRKPQSLGVFLGALAIVEALAALDGQILLVVLVVDDEGEAERVAVQGITRQFRPRVLLHRQIPERLEEAQLGRERGRTRLERR